MVRHSLGPVAFDTALSRGTLCYPTLGLKVAVERALIRSRMVAGVAEAAGGTRKAIGHFV